MLSKTLIEKASINPAFIVKMAMGSFHSIKGRVPKVCVIGVNAKSSTNASVEYPRYSKYKYKIASALSI